VCAIQFLFAVKLVKSPQGDQRYCCRERLKHSIVCSGIHSPYYYIKFRGFCLQLYTVT
jgi:hypothetical protein